MEFKGTKGKWEVYHSDHIGCTNVKFGSEEWEGFVELWHHHSSDKEAKANALLISKAPDYHQELLDTITDLKILQGNILASSKTDKRWEGMNEVIQKWIDRKEQLLKSATEIE